MTIDDINLTILQLLAEHKFLTTQQIAKFLHSENRLFSSTVRIMSRRLQTLQAKRIITARAERQVGGVGQGDRYGWAVHGYPIRITRTRNEWINMRGVIQSIEARLILTNGGGTDDRATSGIMSWIGGDWYNNNSSWMNEHKHARLRLVSNDWDIYGNTDIPAATLRLNKPPGWT